MSLSSVTCCIRSKKALSSCWTSLCSPGDEGLRPTFGKGRLMLPMSPSSGPTAGSTMWEIEVVLEGGILSTFRGTFVQLPRYRTSLSYRT
jgi:hypothetical protein